MQYRELGNTGIMVSEVGVGCGGLGGPLRQGLDKALEYAVDQGVTLFDTADSYAEGQSETVLGRVLEKKRDKLIYATKFASVIHNDGTSGKDVSTKHMREAIESSLQRLRTDYIDIYQLHNPPMSFLNDAELITALDSLVDEGKIRCYGLSIDNTNDALNFLDQTKGKSIQMFLNLFSQSNRSPFLEETIKRKAGVIIKVPMAGGTLTGRFSKDYPQENDSRRRRWGEDDFQNRLELIEKVRPILETPTRTMAQGALAWLLTLDGVSAVIPGISSLDKIKDTIGAAEMRLTPEEMAELDNMENGLIKNVNLKW
ncbi:MAG: aldo/keto reductase [Kiritimatiellae bacterium]|nr:aldo/keto reductase [Kiritimatiellia bacterium]